MKTLLVILALTSALLANAQTNDVNAEVQAVVAQINTKLKAGLQDETNLTAEIAEFDQLLARHKGEQTDPVAGILFAKIKLYVEVLHNPQRGIELLRQLKRDFPETGLGKEADRIIAGVQQQVDMMEIQRSLVPGAKFPDFDAKDLAGNPASVALHKGKVLLVDFWATWCVPCQMQMPYVHKAYEHYHDRGFDIVGISLDQDEQKLRGFLQDKHMSWPQICEGKSWDSKLVRKYGVESIPATFLLDTDGKIIARDLRGDALVEAVGKALPVKPAPASAQ